jgi:hypothetical protein
MKGLHLVPSLNRIEKLKHLCESLKATETKYPGWIIVDVIDYESKKALYDELKATHLLPNWEFRITNGVTMAAKIREVWPEIESLNLDWIQLMNDDHYVVTPQWDERLSSQILGTNFITCSDRWMAPMKAAGATMISMGLIKVWGFPIFPPGLEHLFIDDFFEVVGNHTGCWDIDMSVVVLHKHVLNQSIDKQSRLLDKTHQMTYAQSNFQKEKYVWDQFLATEMNPLLERVREFIKPVIQKRATEG